MYSEYRRILLRFILIPRRMQQFWNIRQAYQHFELSTVACGRYILYIKINMQKHYFKMWIRLKMSSYTLFWFFVPKHYTCFFCIGQNTRKTSDVYVGLARSRSSNAHSYRAQFHRLFCRSSGEFCTCCQLWTVCLLYAYWSFIILSTGIQLYTDSDPLLLWTTQKTFIYSF